MAERFELAKDYTISRVINGCWQLSEGHSLQTNLDKQDIMKAFNMLVEKGFTTFDCADIYTGTEEFLGEFLKQLKHGSTISPNDIQIHTKYVPDINLLSDVDFTYTEKIIDRSLKRQNRDVLDLVQFHWWDYDVPGYIETAGDLLRLKEKGKIRNIAVTNFDTKHLKEIVDAGIPIVSCQNQYSVFDRRPEKELLEYCKIKGISLLCYGTLSGGLLAEKWLGKTSIQPDTRSHVKYLQVIEETLGWVGYQELLLLLDKIAKKYSVNIAHVATKYILSQQGVGASIIGVRNSSHVESNAQIFSFELDCSDIEEINHFLHNYSILEGEPFELERTAGSKFRNIMKMNLNEE
ncbi:aldo/keto reductase [Peribacillus huizhouensis]|uniref:Aryl-alcohol dehydrogenase-like predicted oxidoreductase n=1 Tax=Peribacillus huizhouensis TaxID=1501239 RepID=A0ABR6CN07_9BACI|nr:aldo/keto reductase [Peribacillus huizhouensis]MBA9026422.1 aryl-alcohol dehydrogenase-like predicted oxidoreductase [Peribacillus huizhouensis]